MDNEAFEKWGLGRRTTVNIGDVSEVVEGVRRELSRSRQPWDNEDVRNAIEKKFGSSELALSGIAKIVKGENPIVGLNSSQFEVVEALYGILSVDAIMDDIRATVGTVSEDKVEGAKLIWLYAKIKDDEILVSQGLARKLGLSGNEEIRILNVNQDVTNLNLDDYLRK